MNKLFVTAATALVFIAGNALATPPLHTASSGTILAAADSGKTPAKKSKANAKKAKAKKAASKKEGSTETPSGLTRIPSTNLYQNK